MILWPKYSWNLWLCSCKNGFRLGCTTLNPSWPWDDLQMLACCCSGLFSSRIHLLTAKLSFFGLVTLLRAVSAAKPYLSFRNLQFLDTISVCSACLLSHFYLSFWRSFLGAESESNLGLQPDVVWFIAAESEVHFGLFPDAIKTSALLLTDAADLFWSYT